MNSLDILLFSFLLLISLITIIGNLLVIIAFSKESRLRHLTGGWCLVSLATADLCIGIVRGIPAAIQQTLGSWILGENICLIWTSFDIIFSTVSLLHLIIICTDRYIAISRPLSYSKKSTRRAITVLLVAAWILPTIAAAAKTIKSKSVILFNLKLSQYCMPGDRKLAARIVITIILFIMPTVAVIAMYGRIVYILRQKNLKIGIQYPRSESPKPGNIPNGETDNNVDGLNRNHVQEKTNTSKLEPHTARNLVNASQSEINIARTKRIQGLVSAVILLYLICWSPVFTLMLLQAAGLDVNYTLLAVCHWLGAVNAALNPWLYGFMNRDIRKVLCNIVCCRKSNMNSSSG